MGNASRREFLKSTVTAACAVSLGGTLAGSVSGAPPSSTPAIKKGVLLDMLQANLSYAARLKLARCPGHPPREPPCHKKRSSPRHAAGESLVRRPAQARPRDWVRGVASSH